MFQSVYYHNKPEVVFMDLMTWLLLIVGILAIVFVVVEFIDMLKNKRIKKDTKLVLIILFIVASLVTAIIYWIWKKV
jgi:uncharacterized membrane protein